MAIESRDARPPEFGDESVLAEDFGFGRMSRTNADFCRFSAPSSTMLKCTLCGSESAVFCLDRDGRALALLWLLLDERSEVEAKSSEQPWMLSSISTDIALKCRQISCFNLNLHA
jgi:hypothetical protein